MSVALAAAPEAGSNSRIVAAWRDLTPGSAALAQDAAKLFPSGITHDARHLDPYGIYVERAQGAHKWDVDGNRYVDFFGGHGALILGHAHPAVTRAVAEAAGAGHAVRRQPPARGRTGRARCSAWCRRPSACASPPRAPRRR